LCKYPIIKEIKINRVRCLIKFIYRHFSKFHPLSQLSPCLKFLSWRITTQSICHHDFHRKSTKIEVFQQDYQAQDTFGSLGNVLVEEISHLMSTLAFAKA